MFLMKLCRVCKKYKIVKRDITTGRDKKTYEMYIENKMVCVCEN